MATIKRHSIPADSFEPNRPLNDLLQAQLQHFHVVEKRLPRHSQPTLHPDMPPPSPLDAPASNRYIAAMTTLIRQRAANQTAKQPAKDRPAKSAPVLVPKPARHRTPAGIPIAASASDVTPSRSAAVRPARKNKKAATPKSRKP